MGHESRWLKLTATEAETQGFVVPPKRESRSERVLTSRCGHCGDVFEPTRPHQRFCKPSCRKAAFTGRQPQPRLLSMDPHELFRTPFE